MFPDLLHHDHQIRRGGARAGATDTLRLDRIRRLAQPGGVDQRHGHAAQHHARFQCISGGSGRLRHDRHVSLGQRVHQTGFADIRWAGDREHQALAQPLSAPSVVQMLGNPLRQRRKPGERQRLGFQRQVLAGEVDQRLLLGQQHAQPFGPVAVDLPQRTIELAQRLRPLGGGLGFHQIADRLGLYQVHPAVEEGAAGELTRLGGPRAERHQRLRHALNHRAPAVQMQFGRVLTGVTGGRRQPKHQRLVELFARGIAQPA